MGDVGDPKLVRPSGREVPVHQVRRPRRLILGDRRAPGLAAADAGKAQLTHETGDGAAGHDDPFAPQLAPELAGAVDAEVRSVDTGDLDLQLLVSQCSGRGRPGLGVVVGRRGDRQVPADRLDPEPGLVSVDVGDRLLCRRSSSAAKKAEADLRISFARRSSRFSRSRAFSCSRSVVVRPGLRPSSRSVWRTQDRSVSADMPNFDDTERIVAHCDGCSGSCSNTIRTARSRISSGYLVDLVMAPSSQGLEPPRFPARFTL